MGGGQGCMCNMQCIHANFDLNFFFVLVGIYGDFVYTSTAHKTCPKIKIEKDKEKTILSTPLPLMFGGCGFVVNGRIFSNAHLFGFRSRFVVLHDDL